MQNLKIIHEFDFHKGYNDKFKPELLPENFCADALNCWLDDQVITKRTGYSVLGNDVDISKPVLDMGTVLFSSGTDFILRARDNAGGTQSVIEAHTGSGSWGALTGASSQTAGKGHVFITAKDACYIINDTDTVLKTANGTSTSEIAAFPNGVDARWFHNYMFVITAAGRLFWSELNDPEDWTDVATQFIDVNPNDGDTVVGLGILKDELFIFKKNGMWSLTGFGEADFDLSDMGEKMTGIGAVSRKSIVETSNDIYFLSHTGDIPHFRSVLRTREGFVLAGEVISDPIEGTMKGLTKARLKNTAGMFDGRKIWWAVTDSGIYNNLVVVYDEPTKGWTRHTGINASCFAISGISGTQARYFGEASADAQSYILDSSTSDNGTAINMVFDSPMYNPFPERKCKWKYLTLALDVDSAATLDVDYAKDGFTFDDLHTLTLTGAGGTLPLTLGTGRLGTATIVRERIDNGGGVAYKMQYRFANNTDSDSITIREYQVMYKPKGLRAVAEA